MQQTEQQDEMLQVAMMAQMDVDSDKAQVFQEAKTWAFLLFVFQNSKIKIKRITFKELIF